MSSNPIVHWELMGADGQAQKTFYQSVFDWDLEPVPGFENYFMTTGDGMGVNGAVGQGSEEMPSYLTLYVAVDDINAKLSQVEEAGGSTVMPRTEVPDVVTFALFKDPAGNLVGIVEGE